MWPRGVVVITSAQLPLTKSELRFCTGSNPSAGVSEIRDGKDICQWSRLEIRLGAFRRSAIPQTQFIIIHHHHQHHHHYKQEIVFQSILLNFVFLA